jgi:hypothetical protein
MGVSRRLMPTQQLHICCSSLTEQIYADDRPALLLRSSSTKDARLAFSKCGDYITLHVPGSPWPQVVPLPKRMPTPVLQYGNSSNNSLENSQVKSTVAKEPKPLSRKRERSLSETDAIMPLIIRDSDSHPVLNSNALIVQTDKSGLNYSTTVVSMQNHNGIDLIQSTNTGSDIQAFPVARLPRYIDASKVNAMIQLPTATNHENEIRVVLNSAAQRAYCSDEIPAGIHLPAIVRKDKRMLEPSRAGKRLAVEGSEPRDRDRDRAVISVFPSPVEWIRES